MTSIQMLLQTRRPKDHSYIFPRVLSYISVLELLSLHSVSKQWKDLVRETFRTGIQTIDLSQFWSMIGVIEPGKFTTLISSFQHVTGLSLAFCHFNSDACLLSLMQALPKNTDLSSLNLYYNYGLTNQTVDTIVKNFPNLTHLDIGRCSLITDDGVARLVRSLPKLRRLGLAYDKQLTGSALEAIEADCQNLVYLDLSFCNLEVSLVEEYKKEKAGVIHVVGPKPLALGQTDDKAKPKTGKNQSGNKS